MKMFAGLHPAMETMLKVLVIYSHPLEISFGAKLHTAVLEGLAAAKHQVVDVDLYAEGFSPVLSRQEYLHYRETGKNCQYVRKYVDQLQAAQGIVLVYPTWWYGMPAILKGYIDRVWLPGVAFDITSDGSIATDRLHHVCRLAAVTTYGSPWWFNSLYLGNPGRRIVARGLRRLCAKDCRVGWHALYDMDRAGPQKLQAFVDRVRIAMRKL